MSETQQQLGKLEIPLAEKKPIVKPKNAIAAKKMQDNTTNKMLLKLRTTCRET